MGKIYTVKWTLIAAGEYQLIVDWLIKNRNEKIVIWFYANINLPFGSGIFLFSDFAVSIHSAIIISAFCKAAA